MRNLEGAKCAGKFALFDCHIIAVHVEARKLCDDCPVKAACRSLLVEVLAESGTRAAAPSGTWAGLLYKQGRRVRVPRNYEQAVS